MPRQIDLFSQNLQVNNDPNNQISVTAAQINSLKDQIPEALAKAEQLLIDNILSAIDNATGLDFVDWIAEAQQFFNFVSASLQQSWVTLQNFFNGLAQEADADVTAALAWLQGQFNQLQALLQQSWLSFQNLLNGIIQETDADVAAVVTYLNGVGESANKAWTQIEDFINTGDWSDLTTAWNDLMQGIFGSSTSLGLVGQIPAPAVVNVTQNLQPVWDFPDAASVSASGQWSWDGTQDHTGVTGSGSAKYACNGTLGALRGIPGAVSPSQVVTPIAWVMWSGVSATSGTSPFQLELIPYSGAGSSLFPGTPVTIASVTSPGSSHAWEELTGTYTVPSSGVTAVQLRLVVTADATAGSVWWDDCQADLSGGFLADLQSDTNEIINSFAPGGTSAEFLTGVTNLLALFGLTPADIGGATVINTVWTDVINDIINPLNALEISAVNGLASALSALLGTTTFQTLLDSVANALGHSGTGHTITNIETYLGLIPPANVTNVLGGANLGADVSSVHTTATNGTAWSTRLTNDLLITSDVFHLTYQAGTSTDAPGTLGTNGKPTWYSAWNDLLSLAGVVNSVTPPTDPAPAVASAITTAQSTANTGVTNAATAQSTANTAQSTLNTTNTNLFGSTTPASTIQTTAVPSGVPATKIANVLGNSNLGADVQAILDYIANALGHTGTGHTLTQIETYLGIIPATNVTNVLGGSSLGTDLTNISNWLFGTTTPTSSTQVQASAVTGAGGQTDLLAAVQAGWDQLVQAFTGTSDTGHSLGQLANAAQGTASTATGALSTAQSATMTQAQQATAKPGYMAIDATMDAVFPLSHMIASPTYISVTAAAPTTGFVRIPDNVSKLSVAWLGSYTGSISSLIINVYAMNTTTGGLTKVITGTNYISSVGTALSWNYYTLPSALTASPGAVYGVEMVIAGSGTYSLMGLSNSTFPQNGSVFPKALGASGASTTTIAPTHDAAGAGSFTNTAGTVFSWSHTIGATATGILISFGTTGTVSTVTVGASAATLVASTLNVAGDISIYMYKLLSPPAGTQAITITLTTSQFLAGNSDSYNGVTSFGTAVTNSSTSSTAASVSVSSGTGQTAVATIFGYQTSALTSFNQTSRWNNATSHGAGVFGDAAGASTVTFSATAAGGVWGAVGVSLVSSTTTFTPTYSTNVPWFGMGTSAIAASPVFAPATWTQSSAGTYTYTIPTWMVSGDYFDIAVLGGGQGGEGGGATSGDWGDGGAAGSWNTATLQYGVDIPTSTKNFTATVGAGSTGGNPNAAGFAGASSSVTITGYSSSPITGAGGNSVEGLDGVWTGQTPGNVTINDTYYGGSAQTNESSPGQAPGGGGGGGHGFGGHGGDGGDGAVWIRAYQ